MTRFGFYAIFAGTAWLAAGGSISLANTRTEAPEFQEIYQLLRDHVAGADDAALNRAAIEGLLTTFGSKVLLVTNGVAAGASSGVPCVSQANVFPGRIAYLRLASVSEGLAAAVQAAYRDLSSTNNLNGIVLDLRYAGGSDYAAAAATADLFIPRALPLVNWGDGVVSSHEKTNAISLPAAIVVNGNTAGASEALAAMLRSAGVGLIIGGRTAGQARVMQSFPLKNGDQLRVATVPITLGNGEMLSADGLKPDIDAGVGVESERAYYGNPYFTLPSTNRMNVAAGPDLSASPGTNAPAPARFDEAELVREHQGGLDIRTRSLPRVRGAEVERPLVTDPALARALDLLKGLAIVRESHA